MQLCENRPFSMIFIEFLVKNFKPRYHGNGQQKNRGSHWIFFFLSQGEHAQKVS